MSMPPVPQDKEDHGPAPAQAVAGVIDCIEQDFRRLVETLARSLETIGSDDEVLRERLAAAWEAAERGLEISRHLLDRTSFDHR